jgi:uncharacterized protein YndB with AHSA1/START domain
MTETKITVTPGIPQVIVEREFDAPAELLLRVHLDPELLKQWLGPRDLTLMIDRYETHNGGTWRFVNQDPVGNEYGFHGVFHGEPSIAGIVQTFEYEGAPGHVKLDTTTFEEREGKTLLRTVSSFQSVDDRDVMVATGMERGLRDSGDRLDALLDALAPAR